MIWLFVAAIYLALAVFLCLFIYVETKNDGDEGDDF